MLIIGEMNIGLKQGAGQFYCPRCQADRDYVHKRVRRFLTIYFIPLIPMDTVAEHVQCQQCRQTFSPSTIHLNRQDYQTLALHQFADDVRRVMVLVMLADDTADPEEILVLRSVYQQLTQRVLSDDEIRRDVFQARKARVAAATYARAIASRRTDEEKDWIVRGAFRIASAKGDLTEERLTQLKLIPTALGMSEERFRRIIESEA